MSRWISWNRRPKTRAGALDVETVRLVGWAPPGLLTDGAIGLGPDSPLIAVGLAEFSSEDSLAEGFETLVEIGEASAAAFGAATRSLLRSATKG